MGKEKFFSFVYCLFAGGGWEGEECGEDDPPPAAGVVLQPTVISLRPYYVGINPYFLQ